MPLASGRQVNEKPFKIGINSQNFARFDPLSWEKTLFFVPSYSYSSARFWQMEPSFVNGSEPPTRYLTSRAGSRMQGLVMRQSRRAA
jgi:hypothetical protein